MVFSLHEESVEQIDLFAQERTNRNLDTSESKALFDDLLRDGDSNVFRVASEVASVGGVAPSDTEDADQVTSCPIVLRPALVQRKLTPEQSVSKHEHLEENGHTSETNRAKDNPN